jgi:hypothetical protein
MRKLIPMTLLAVALLLAAGAVALWQRNAGLIQQMENAQASRDATQTQFGEALGAIAEIQDSLSTLGVSEATNPLMPGSRASEGGLSAEQKSSALDRIALLKAGITRTKDRIRALEGRLHKSGVHVASLERMITSLKRVTLEREAQVAALSAQVDSLHTEVSGLTAVVAATRDSIQTQSLAINDQRRQIGTVYYVIGTRGDLQRAGVVKPLGGVLGLGKTLTAIPADAATAMFKPIDTNVERVITIPAPRARVVSAQPTSSYSLVPSGKQVELRITDPAEFRTVKRLVIVSMS